MNEPKRIQLRRTKGWRKPEGAVSVSRPSKWGNPYKVGRSIFRLDGVTAQCVIDAGQWPSLYGRPMDHVTPLAASVVVDAYALWIIERPSLMVSLSELRGHDLACWCPLDAPCHADVLLELANR